MNNNSMQHDLFEQAPISKAVAQLSLPTIAIMMVTVCYNLADTFFVGQTGDSMQVAAVSLAMPIFLILLAFGNLFGIGGSATISRFLGEQKLAEIRNISSFCFYGGLATGVLLAAITIPLMHVIVPLTGATTATYDFVYQYLIFIAIGAPFVIISTAFGSIVRSIGLAKQSMIGMMIGTITNIILDPIMILLLDMGVVGAAVATVIGNLFATLYFIQLLRKSDGIFSIHITHCKISLFLLGNIIKIGIPAAINNILMSVANIICNVFLSKYGEVPIAAMGISLKSGMIFAMFHLGLSMGVQPLIGYNYGARNYDRMKQIIKYVIKVSLCAGLVFLIFFQLSAASIVSAFISDIEVVEIGTKMLRIQSTTAIILGIMFISMSALQSMNQGVSSLVLSVCRQGVIFIPVAFIADQIWGLDGLIFAQPVADFASVVIGAILLKRALGKLSNHP